MKSPQPLSMAFTALLALNNAWAQSNLDSVREKILEKISSPGNKLQSEGLREFSKFRSQLWSDPAFLDGLCSAITRVPSLELDTALSILHDTQSSALNHLKNNELQTEKWRDFSSKISEIEKSLITRLPETIGYTRVNALMNIHQLNLIHKKQGTSLSTPSFVTLFKAYARESTLNGSSFTRAAFESALSPLWQHKQTVEALSSRSPRLKKIAEQLSPLRRKSWCVGALLYTLE